MKANKMNDSDQTDATVITGTINLVPAGTNDVTGANVSDANGNTALTNENLGRKTSERKEMVSNYYLHSSFEAFDPLSQLWTDYEQQFLTFLEANSIPQKRKSHVFLTNQLPVTNKLFPNFYQSSSA